MNEGTRNKEGDRLLGHWRKLEPLRGLQILTLTVVTFFEGRSERKGKILD